MSKIILAASNAAATQRWHGIVQEALPEFEVLVWEPGASQAGARYAIVWTPPDDVFRVETKLEAIFNLGAGVDGLFSLPSLPDVPVFRLEDAGMAPQMAEYVIHHLSSFSRGFSRYQAAQQKSLWTRLPALRYEDWPVGVLGLGKLGGHVARAVAAMGYPIAGWARHPRQTQDIEIFHGKDQLRAFIGRTRVLVNLLPLTPETSGIIDSELLSGLLPDGVLINIARGGHVVDADLLAALNSGKLQAAVLDVFNEEPLPQGHPYWTHPNVRVTPHVSGMAQDAEAVAQVSQRIRLFEQGETASGLVRRDAGY